MLRIRTTRLQIYSSHKMVNDKRSGVVIELFVMKLTNDYRGICNSKSLPKQFSCSNPFHAKIIGIRIGVFLTCRTRWCSSQVLQERESVNGADHLAATAARSFPPPPPQQSNNHHSRNHRRTTPAPDGAHPSREPATSPPRPLVPFPHLAAAASQLAPLPHPSACIRGGSSPPFPASRRREPITTGAHLSAHIGRGPVHDGRADQLPHRQSIIPVTHSCLLLSNFRLIQGQYRLNDT
jgi:hypothetical protein